MWPIACSSAMHYAGVYTHYTMVPSKLVQLFFFMYNILFCPSFFFLSPSC